MLRYSCLIVGVLLALLLLTALLTCRITGIPVSNESAPGRTEPAGQRVATYGLPGA